MHLSLQLTHTYTHTYTHVIPIFFIQHQHVDESIMKSSCDEYKSTLYMMKK